MSVLLFCVLISEGVICVSDLVSCFPSLFFCLFSPLGSVKLLNPLDLYFFKSSVHSWQHKPSVCLHSGAEVNELLVQRMNYEVKTFLVRTCLGSFDLNLEIRLSVGCKWTHSEVLAWKFLFPFYLWWLSSCLPSVTFSNWRASNS